MRDSFLSTIMINSEGILRISQGISPPRHGPTMLLRSSPISTSAMRSSSKIHAGVTRSTVPKGSCYIQNILHAFVPTVSNFSTSSTVLLLNLYRSSLSLNQSKRSTFLLDLDARKDGCSERWMLKSSLKKSYSATYIPLFFWFSLLYFYHVRIHRKVQKGYFKLLKLERPCTASQSIFLPRHISEICK